MPALSALGLQKKPCMCQVPLLRLTTRCRGGRTFSRLIFWPGFTTFDAQVRVSLLGELASEALLFLAERDKCTVTSSAHRNGLLCSLLRGIAHTNAIDLH